MSHVFISYSRKDTEYAHELADELSQRGIEVWIDDRIEYSSQWPQDIQAHLEACPAFVLIMSPNSYHSTWVQNELTFAIKKGKRLYPLLLEGEDWLSVASIQYADVRGNKLPPERFMKAIKSLESIPIFQTNTLDLRQEKRRELIEALKQGWNCEGSSFWKVGIYEVIYTSLESHYACLVFLYDVELLKQYNPVVYARYRTVFQKPPQEESIKEISIRSEKEAKFKEENNMQFYWTWETYPDPNEVEIIVEIILDSYEKLKIPLEKISIIRTEH